jgi:hypothetical protein
MITKRSIRIPIVPQRRTENTIAAFIVAVVLAVCALNLWGCKDAATPAAAFDAADKALVGVNVTGEVLLDRLVELREVRMEQCKGEPTPEAREACLGPLAQPLRPLAERVAAAYDGAVRSLDELEEAVAAVQQLVNEVSKP